MKKQTVKPKAKSKPQNGWIKHLKEFAKKHPEMKYSDCMIEAKKTYKPGK